MGMAIVAMASTFRHTMATSDFDFGYSKMEIVTLLRSAKSAMAKAVFVVLLPFINFLWTILASVF